MKQKIAILSAVLVLVLAVLACGLPSSEPTQQASGSTQQASEPTLQPPVEQVIGELEINQAYGFQDSYGDYYVVGEVLNSTNQAVTNVELSIEILDAGGLSLLTDENDAVVPYLTFYPMLSNLAPGKSTPFLYYLSSDAGVPDSYQIKVETFETTTVNRAEVEAENVYVYNDGEGTIYLSGELVNKNNSWVYINGLAGGMLDANDQLVTADWTFIYAAALAPAGDPDGFDRTPFSMYMTAPDVEVSSWGLYWDTAVIDQPVTSDLQISLTTNYFDDYGDFHIVGTLANNSDQYLTVRLVAGLYDASGNVIDADYATMPVTVAPGASAVPFDINYFSSVNWNEEVAAVLSTFTVQVDWYNTYEPYYEVVELQTADDNVQQDGSMLTFSGTVTNTSAKNLSGVSVLIYIQDKSGVVVAMNSTTIWPEGDTIAPGAVLPYEVTIYGDPAVTFTEDYIWYTYVQGDVE